MGSSQGALEHRQESNNTSDEPGNITVVQLMCFPVIVTVGLIGNFLICVAVTKRRKLRTIDYFVLNLAATDLATCIVSIPFDFVVILANHWPFGFVLCKVVVPLQTTLMAVSVYTLLLMGWERHRVVMPPFKPNLNGKNTLAILFVVWIASIALVGPYFTIHDIKKSADGTIQCREKDWPSGGAKTFTLVIFILLYLLPLLAIMLNYIRIGQKLWTDIQRMRRVIGERRGSRKPLIQARAHRNMRIVKILVLVVIAFAVCMAPNHVMWLWHDFGSGSSFPHFESILVFCHLLVYSNSAINPFIFVFLHSRYCKTFFLKCCLQATTRPVSRGYRYRRRHVEREADDAAGKEDGMRNYLVGYDDELARRLHEAASMLALEPPRTASRVNFRDDDVVDIFESAEPKLQMETAL